MGRFSEGVLYLHTYAITSQQLDVVIADRLSSGGRAGPIASFSLKATPAVPGREISVGIAPQADPVVDLRWSKGLSALSLPNPLT